MKVLFCKGKCMVHIWRIIKEKNLMIISFRVCVTEIIIKLFKMARCRSWLLNFFYFVKKSHVFFYHRHVTYIILLCSNPKERHNWVYEIPMGLNEPRRSLKLRKPINRTILSILASTHVHEKFYWDKMSTGEVKPAQMGLTLYFGSLSAAILELHRSRHLRVLPFPITGITCLYFCPFISIAHQFFGRIGPSLYC